MLKDGINNYCWAFLLHLTAVRLKSSPDLRLPVYTYNVVSLHDIFTVPLQRERIVLSWFRGEEVRLREVQV